jgi:protein kinase-like protein
VAREGARLLSVRPFEPLTPDWKRVTAVFDEALMLDGEARERMLARVEATDPRVAAEVRALLTASDSAPDFLDKPVWAAAPELLADTPEASLTGRRIGPYQVGERVGRGGMGVVYAAQDERLGRAVALKLLPPAFSRDARARERLAREARAAAALSHPSIATVYALEEIDGDLFIATELVRGASLRESLASGPLARGALHDTLVQIAEALEAAHRHGIVHRDLKPDNVLRTAEGRIKVVDFGIARHLAPMQDPKSALTLTGTALGTPGYMAPEQLRGQPVTASADIFAFGVMAYELATGVHPFGGSDPAAVLERLVSGDPPLSRPIDPPGLDVIIRRCVVGNPASRYQSGADLLQALRGLVTGHVPQRPAPPVTGTGWWWKFHQVAVSALTMAAVIMVGFHKGWVDPYGSAAFLGILVLATITTTLRLHLWFVAQVHPATLVPLRARVLRWVMVCETLLLICLMAFGITVAGPHPAAAAQLVVTSLLLFLSLIVIEPATTRASLADS